ncbi:putative quinol monooxygenase [Sagittula sp. MA-2]|jgi:quinol monooxygenase YgiN|uniref:putative quinol monooxygenase n=1 Tax=Sagittula sp. MA-2 TaxID=3048007 RepID=UPI0024C35B37|nr:antibiotic biosynthesis monooxygenase [Sagittula sp. MA-2]WHZ35820.1 antibiotic biosynthesis monooxygenase [Sagittula sp. MA-2]
MIELTGRLVCADAAEAERVRQALPEHVALTRAEPGCLSFEVEPCGPLVWRVAERFTDSAAFEAHQKRMRESDWGRTTAGIKRDYEIREIG